MVAFPEPTAPRSTRSAVFLEYLAYFRERAIEKVEELSPDEATTSRVPSGWTPVELLTHLCWVERRWLEWGFLGRDIGDPWGDERDDRWHVPADLAPGTVVHRLRAQGERTADVVRAHRLDERGVPGPRWRGAEPATLERVLFHLVQEWARHLGHLDIVVELASAQVGE